MRIIIINGPNLNLLGKREPSVYGTISFEDYLEELRAEFGNMQLDYFQSNVEGEIINKLQETGFDHDGIILNAGGYTHTSVAIADAVRAIESPVVEVHISNIFAREEYRHISYISPHAWAVLSGFGIKGYRLAVMSFL
ncbi:MAG: type II 3-dehydroquinate dehydratase [Bacteroidales bacterium]|nr:type II 3-dehydroquinate dehydratase [Bacteroidales bacterium]